MKDKYNEIKNNVICYLKPLFIKNDFEYIESKQLGVFQFSKAINNNFVSVYIDILPSEKNCFEINFHSPLSNLNLKDWQYHWEYENTEKLSVVLKKLEKYLDDKFFSKIKMIEFQKLIINEGKFFNNQTLQKKGFNYYFKESGKRVIFEYYTFDLDSIGVYYLLTFIRKKDDFYEVIRYENDLSSNLWNFRYLYFPQKKAGRQKIFLITDFFPDYNKSNDTDEKSIDKMIEFSLENENEWFNNNRPNQKTVNIDTLKELVIYPDISKLSKKIQKRLHLFLENLTIDLGKSNK